MFFEVFFGRFLGVFHMFLGVFGCFFGGKVKRRVFFGRGGLGFFLGGGRGFVVFLFFFFGFFLGEFWWVLVGFSGFSGILGGFGREFVFFFVVFFLVEGRRFCFFFGPTQEGRGRFFFWGGGGGLGVWGFFGFFLFFFVFFFLGGHREVLGTQGVFGREGTQRGFWGFLVFFGTHRHRSLGVQVFTHQSTHHKHTQHWHCVGLALQ